MDRDRSHGFFFLREFLTFAVPFFFFLAGRCFLPDPFSSVRSVCRVLLRDRADASRRPRAGAVPGGGRGASSPRDGRVRQDQVELTAVDVDVSDPHDARGRPADGGGPIGGRPGCACRLRGNR